MLIKVSLKGKQESYEGVRSIKIRRNYVKLAFWPFLKTYRRPIFYNRDEWLKSEMRKKIILKPEDVSVKII